MKYTIGIGVLIDNRWHNHIREIELQISDTIGNFAGLSQPPHVTVKGPFEVDGTADIRKCEQIMISLAKRSKIFDITFDGFGNFGDSVLFLRVKPNDTLTAMHNQLLTSLEPIFSGSTGSFEGAHVTFHSTLAMGLKAGQFSKARQLLNTYPKKSLVFTTPVQKLGLFLGINNNTHWAVIAETELRNISPI